MSRRRYKIDKRKSEKVLWILSKKLRDPGLHAVALAEAGVLCSESITSYTPALRVIPAAASLLLPLRSPAHLRA